MRRAILAIPRILVVFFLVVLVFFVTLVVHSLLQKFLNSCCTSQMCLCSISCTWFYPEISDVMLHVSNNAFSVLLRRRQGSRETRISLTNCIPRISPCCPRSHLQHKRKEKIMEKTVNWRISVNKRTIASHHFTMVGCLSGKFT